MKLNKAEFQGALWWWVFKFDSRPDGWTMDSNWEDYQKNPDDPYWNFVLDFYKQLTTGNGKVNI